MEEIQLFTITLPDTEQKVTFYKNGEKNYGKIKDCFFEISEIGVQEWDEDKLPSEIINQKEYVINEYYSWMSKANNRKNDDLASGFDGDDYNQNDEIITPYDPSKITVSTARFSLKEIENMIAGDDEDEPVLDLNPEFQRYYVWDNKRSSRLIESILLNIPLPVFYFSRDINGKLQVVDGVQRLTTIHRFFNNQFRLTDLEYLALDCDKCYYKEKNTNDKVLLPKQVRALRQYQIDCNIIEPSTPENVKLDIFKRLNTGGQFLNKQEVRHAFMKKDIRVFLKKMSDSEEFKIATDNSIKPNRMLDQELILRFLGFVAYRKALIQDLKYNRNMDEFLDDICVKLNETDVFPYESVERMFLSSMRKSTIMFGKKSFRRYTADKTNPINKSLFIAFSLLLIEIDMDIVEKRGSIIPEFGKELANNKKLEFNISHNTNYQLPEAIIEIKSFLDNIYGENND